jgi:hypothetical protein
MATMRSGVDAHPGLTLEPSSGRETAHAVERRERDDDKLREVSRTPSDDKPREVSRTPSDAMRAAAAAVARGRFGADVRRLRHHQIHHL